MSRGCRCGRWRSRILFFHLKTGQEILSRRALVRQNLFSFTYPDFPNLDTSWLAEVGAALVFRGGGFPAIVVAKTLVLLVAFAGAYRVCRRQGAGRASSALALAAAAFVGRDRFVERPHLFSLLGEVATLLAAGALETGGPGARRAAGWFLVAVVVWANLHAGVFVAPLMLGAVSIALALQGERAGAGRAALVAGGAALAMLATPLGLDLFRYLRLHLVIPAVHSVDEFRAPSWSSDAPLVIYGAVAAAAVAWVIRAGGAPARRRSLRALAPVLPLAVLALHAIRFGADAALVGAPLLAVAFTAAGERLAARWPALAVRLVPLSTLAVPALLIALSLAPRVAAGSPFQGDSGIGLDRRELPLEAIAFVDEKGLRERMYNDFEIGSYLLFDPIGGFPRHRVFVDPRLPAYPLEMHRLLGRGDLSRDEWTAAMDSLRRRERAAGLRGGQPSGGLVGPPHAGRWSSARTRRASSCDGCRAFASSSPSTRFRRRSPSRSRKGPPRFPWRRARPPPRSRIANGIGGSASSWSSLDDALSERARAAYTRALAAPAGCLAPIEESRLGAWLGAVDLSAGQPKEALALLERSLAAGNRELSTLTIWAAALEALGRVAAAAAAWKQVAARAGDSPLGVRARARAEHLEN